MATGVGAADVDGRESGPRFPGVAWSLGCDFDEENDEAGD
jgi:hypothetical protein